MKLNNKGVSIIEIVVTFSMIMIMIVSMIGIVLNYRMKASTSLEKLKMDTFKNTLTSDIQKDISKYGVVEINSDGECSELTFLNQCVNIVFKNKKEKVFGVSKIDPTDRNSIENKYFYYDGIKYKIHDDLPEVIPEGRNILDFQEIRIENNNILSVDSTILNDGTVVSIYSIDVFVSHVDFDQDFGIHITTSTDDSKDDKLADLILENNSIIDRVPNFQATELDPDDIPGLYKSTDTNFNGEIGLPTYYFRGNVKNNYVEFAGLMWRIIRVNEDGTVRIRTIDTIKSTNFSGPFTYYVKQEPGVFNYELKQVYFSESGPKGIKGVLDDWFKEKITNKKLNDRVATGNYFCEELRVVEDRVGYNLGGVNATVKPLSTYTPSFKCNKDGNGYGLVSTNVALITLDECIYAGWYKNGGFYKDIFSSYLFNDVRFIPYWWTMTPAGFSSNDSTGTNYVWRNAGYSTGARFEVRTPGTYGNEALAVINLKNDVTATGIGTYFDPYVIK